MPLNNRTSTLANPDPLISPTLVERNYKVLESLLRERMKQICNEDIHTELEYYSEEYDKEREMEPRPARVKCKYVTRNTGKGRNNKENADSYKGLRRNTYDSVTYPFDYRVTLGFSSIAGGLDLVSPVIRLPIERGINSGTMIEMSNAGQPETTINEYLTKIRDDSGPGIVKPLNFEQESNEPLHLAWERFNESLYNCPEHKINEHEQLQIFYQGLDIETRRKVDFKEPIPRMTPAAGIKAITELSRHSLSWYKEGDFKNNDLNIVFGQINNFEQNMNNITEEVRMVQHKYKLPDEEKNSKPEETLRTLIEESRRKHKQKRELILED
ncbi:hypothetical protein Tco_0972456 [Tanacetum coccineum]